MGHIAVSTLWVLPVAIVAAQEPSRGAVSKPEECAGFRAVTSSLPAEHVPYPKTGKPWPIDVARARIVKDSTVARPGSDHFRPIAVEQVREHLRRSFVVSRREWEQEYSHVAGGDEGGWLVAGSRCFMWTIRPGGLAWIVYPDGAAVYLAAEVRRPS